MGPRYFPPLYLVTDRVQAQGRPLPELLEQILPLGNVMVQLREKDLETRPLLELARHVQQVTEQFQVPLLINDRVDLALALKVQGVHLPSTSLPIAQVRRLLHADQILGCSVHSVEEAVQAEEKGADFAVLGPVYDTPSKREYGLPVGLKVLEEACHRCQMPIYGIGGITAARAKHVKRVGAKGVAVISAILHAECVQSATQKILDAWMVESQH